MSFNNWKKKQAGETVTIYTEPTHDDEGYYRIPVTEAKLNAAGKTNGQRRVIGWRPVAYFLNGGTLCGVVDERDMTDEEVVSLWQWCCNRTISEELYRAIAERGERWPDLHPPVGTAMTRLADTLGDIAEITNPNREAIGGNNPPDDTPPDVAHAEAINNAVRAARDLQATDEVSAGILLGSMNRIAELRLTADKAGHAIYDPLHAVYKAEQKKWPPMIAVASAMEAALNRRYLTWRAAEKVKADAAAAEAARKAQELEEANARAADRAIAQGIAEPAPVIPEVPPESAAAQKPVAPTYRAPGQRTTPKEVETWHLDGINDYDAVYAAFKDSVEVKALLLKLAAAAVKNGQEVPGTRRHFGLV